MQWERPDAARKAQWNSENIMCDGRGLRLRDCPPLLCRLHEVVDRHFRRFGWPASPYGRSWFRALKARLGPDAVIAVAMRGETVLGVTVALRKEKTFQTVIACVDHEASGNDMTHFNLT